jgi:hypothetical protein
MKLGILGGGFGLYGYLPAATQGGFRVYTLSKYREFISQRAELSDFERYVHFVDDESVLLDISESLIVARDPLNQFKIVSERAGQYKNLFLEKPLGANLNAHKESLSLLIERNQNFSVGYLAPYTDWFQELDFVEMQKIRIQWNCRIDPNSWKSSTFPNRGLFSYFGVHLLPLIYKLDPKKIEIVKSTDENILQIKLLTESNCVEIFLSEGSSPSFHVSAVISGKQTTICASDSPFGKQGKRGSPDPRIPLLVDYLNDGLNGSSSDNSRAYEELFLKLSFQIQNT